MSTLSFIYETYTSGFANEKNPLCEIIPSYLEIISKFAISSLCGETMSLVLAKETISSLCGEAISSVPVKDTIYAVAGTPVSLVPIKETISALGGTLAGILVYLIPTKESILFVSFKVVDSVVTSLCDTPFTQSICTVDTEHVCNIFINDVILNDYINNNNRILCELLHSGLEGFIYTIQNSKCNLNLTDHIRTCEKVLAISTTRPICDIIVNVIRDHNFIECSSSDNVTVPVINNTIKSTKVGPNNSKVNQSDKNPLKPISNPEPTLETKKRRKANSINVDLQCVDTRGTINDEGVVLIDTLDSTASHLMILYHSLTSRQVIISVNGTFWRGLVINSSNAAQIRANALGIGAILTRTSIHYLNANRYGMWITPIPNRIAIQVGNYNVTSAGLPLKINNRFVFILD